MKKSPNVLWLMSDQHHASCYGAGGRAEIRTPALDSLAAGGVSFDRAYCNSTICAPSRASFITGQYALRHGITGNNIFELNIPAATTVSSVFRNAGYQTAMIGKGHMVRAWDERGFEMRRYCDLTDADRNDPLSCHYFRYLADHGVADLYDLGALNEGHPGRLGKAFVSELPGEHCVERWTGREATRFLKTRDRTRPFFLKVSFQRPHNPLAPSPEDAALYSPEEISLPESSVDLFKKGFEGKPAEQIARVSRSGQGDPYVPTDPQDLQEQLAAYYALITVMDEQIGEILQTLKNQEDFENTIIVYVSDHGDFAGEHGLMLKNMAIYEAVHRIPFLLKAPGLPSGLRSKALVESIDLFPTLCELAGLSIPREVQGTSVLGGLHGIGKPAVYCQRDATEAPGKSAFAIRTADWRLVFSPHTPDDGELYHTAEDPGELANQYYCDEHHAVREYLFRDLMSWMANFRRVHGPLDDQASNMMEKGRLTRLIHKDGVKWSAVSGIRNYS